MIILSQRDPKNDDYEEENALVDNQFKTKTNKLEIKKSVNSSEISSDSKKDNRGLEKKNNKLLNVSKSKDNNKGAELNTNVNTNSKGVNESSATAEKKFGSTLLLNSGVSKEAYKLTNAEKDFIRQTLVQHFLFKDTNNKIITSLINLMEIERLQPNQVLYEEKSVGDKFFIVKEGILEETFKNNSQPKLYREGETFGELALLEKRKRDGTMTCKENATLYSLKGLLFRNIVDKMNKEEQKERIAFLSLVPIFQSINKNQLNNIVLNMFTCTFESGQVICKEGETGYSFYIIKSGNVNCESKSGELKRILQPKDFFGEYAVLFDMPRSLNVRAKSKVILYKISTALLEESLGPDYRNIILKSILRESLLSSKHLSLMANISYYNEIYQKTNTILFNNDQQVPLEEYSNTNDEEDNRILYCIISGNFVQKLNNDEKKIITKRGQLFGEEYLENKNKNSLKKNNIYAEGECRVLKLLVKDALKVIY